MKLKITKEEVELLRGIHEEIARQDEEREPLNEGDIYDLKKMIQYIAKLIRSARAEFNPIFRAVRPEDAKDMLDRWELQDMIQGAQEKSRELDE